MSMQAAIYERFGGPISVQVVPIPATPSNGVLVQVMATGVCRSDWHGWKGHDGDIIKHGLPFCPGHEVSGLIVKIGSKTFDFKVGDRVAIPFILSCGSCPHCTRGQPTVCVRQEQPGFTQWGSFAEYVAIPRADRNLRHLPPNVSFVQAAALGCRFTTAYRAVLQQGKLRKEQSVAVFGCGGLGLSCIMVAKSQSQQARRHIVAVDVSLEALEKAKSLGATHTILTNRSQSSQEIAQQVSRVLEGDGADLTIDAAGFTATSQAAVYAARPGGRMVQVGLPHEAPTIPMSLVAGRELTLVGSHGFDAHDLPDLLELISTNPDLDPCQLVEREVSLEEGCQALQDMDRASPLGMVMITQFGPYTSSPPTSSL